MLKRGLLSLVLGILLLGFVSAYSLSDLLGSIESSTILLIAVFTISFAVLNFVLSKFFKDKYGEPNKAIVGVIAFVISFLIAYGINKTGFDIEGLFFDIGISSELLYTIIPIIIIAGIALIIWKFGKKSLFILGVLLILLSFFIYEKTLILTLGIILLLVGVGLSFKKKRKVVHHRPNISFSGPRKNWERGQQIPRRQASESRQEKRTRQAEKENLRQVRRQQKAQQASKQETKQIGVNLRSLTRTYNEIQRVNPADPRLIEITKEIKRIRSQK